MKPFFFGYESPRPLALLRIGLASVLLFDAAVHWPYAIGLYSSDGVPMPLLVGSFFEPIAFSAVPTILLHTLLIFALVAMAVGWNTRLSIVMALVMSAWLGLLDGPGTFKKYSVISLHLMLLLSLSGCGRVWSIDRRLSPIRDRYSPLTAVWPKRLMQILVASVYFGAGITKIQLSDFAAGDLLLFSLLDDLFGGKTLGLWLATQPKLLRLISVGTIVFEFVFAALIWFRRARLPMLSCAILFHVMMWSTLELGIFSPVMLVALLAFVEERDLARLGQFAVRISPLHRRAVDHDLRENRLDTQKNKATWKRWTCHSLYLLTAALFLGTGFAIQYSADWYGVFRESPAQFEVLNEDLVDEMLAAQLPAYEDYFHNVQIGSRISSYQAFGAREQFREGMTVYGLARLVQGHPPLELEWILIAPEGEEIGTVSRRLEKAFSHATAGFRLTSELPAGRYRILLLADGYQVADKSFELVRP